jgi:transmembrane sensor
MDRIADEAGYWDARLRAPDCTDADRARFAQWRDGAASHRAAFERLQMLIATLRGEAGRADVRGLRDAAVARVRRRQRRRTWSVAASIAFLVAGAAIWTMLPEGKRWDPVHAFAALAQPDRYATGIGQRSSVTLRDGSTVELNTRTQLEVRFSDTRRSVKLVEGQALFHVAKNPQRPFVVHAGDREIVAVGTEFDVRLDADSVRVTLLEGRVEVERSGPVSSRPQTLDPGQQLVAELASVAGKAAGTSTLAASAEKRRAAQHGEAVVRTVDVGKFTSWREGRVFFEDLPLGEAVAEMNRYSAIQIKVDDSALSHLHVNGMFRAGEQEAFVAALQDYFLISVTRRGDAEIILAPARAKTPRTF